MTETFQPAAQSLNSTPGDKRQNNNQNENDDDDSIRNHDMLALKHYVQAKDATRYDHIHQDLVLLDLTHSNLQQRHIEIRFSKHDTVAYLKNRIHLKTGTPPHFQELHWYDGATELATLPATSSDTTTNTADSDRLPLGYFGVAHGMRVHCVDTNPHSESARGGYEDTTLVEKFVLSDEAYQARSGTLRQWVQEETAKNPHFSLRRHAAQQRAKSDAIRAQKAGLPLPPGFYVDSRGELEYDSDYERDVLLQQKQKRQQQQPTTTQQSSQNSDSNDNNTDSNITFGPESVQGVDVGMRCQVEPGRRRGKIGFVGEIQELPGEGHWVGIVLDEPVGQNDGSVKGVVYMADTPGPRYGVFVRPTKVQVGDFPERDLLDSDSEDESEEDEL